MHIRWLRPPERSTLLGLWERSVRATHTFLTEADTAFYRPLVAEVVAGDVLEFWVLADSANLPIGFLGLTGQAIERCFSSRRTGHSRRDGSTLPNPAHASRSRRLDTEPVGGAARSVDPPLPREVLHVLLTGVGFIRVGTP